MCEFLSRCATSVVLFGGALLGCALGAAGAEPFEGPPGRDPTLERPRLVVLTDISSLRAGEREPDDGQSLVRLLLTANEFDIEGLVATSMMNHGRTSRPDLIQKVLDAYELAQPQLAKHDSSYPPVERLREVVAHGWGRAGPDVPIEECVGRDRRSGGAERILRAVDRDDPRPVWIVVWGGATDLAQALWQVRETRSPELLARFTSKIRVHAIGDQDSAGPWIKEQFPSLWVLTQQRAYRGMYRGGDERLSSSDWVRRNVHDHGALGDLYPNYDGGDIFAHRLGPVRGVKEGDTPSFLFLLPNGLDGPRRPELGSWGGRFAGGDQRWRDVPDLDLQGPTDPDPRMSTVYRWREAFQNDFAARLDWCVRDVGQANHPPRARVAGAAERAVRPGEPLELDARGSHDPDGDPLEFRWSIYPALPADLGKVEILDPQASTARLIVTGARPGQLVPVLLSVRDRGDPPLTRYARVLATVAP